MKVTFGCDNGANCQSLREETFDTADGIGLDGFNASDWGELTNEEKQASAVEWANDCMEIWFKEGSDGV